MESLYFIAIVPPTEVQQLVLGLKKDVADRFDSKMALKSPAHITMHMPFRWRDKRKEELMEMIQKLNSELIPFEVGLNGFGFFEPRVVFVNVEENEQLRGFQKLVVQHCRAALKILNSNYKDQVFRPHMTIAFRDLKKPMFYEAREYFDAMEFRSTFIADHVTLLKHDGKKWQIDS